MHLNTLSLVMAGLVAAAAAAAPVYASNNPNAHYGARSEYSTVVDAEAGKMGMPDGAMRKRSYGSYSPYRSYYDYHHYAESADPEAAKKGMADGMAKRAEAGYGWYGDYGAYGTYAWYGPGADAEAKKEEVPRRMAKRWYGSYIPYDSYGSYPASVDGEAARKGMAEPEPEMNMNMGHDASSEVQRRADPQVEDDLQYRRYRGYFPYASYGSYAGAASEAEKMGMAEGMVRTARSAGMEGMGNVPADGDVGMNREMEMMSGEMNVDMDVMEKSNAMQGEIETARMGEGMH